MKKTFRFLALALAALMLALAFVGCGNEVDTGDNTGAAATTAPAAVETTPETESPYDDQGYLKDDVPADLRFDGTTLRMLYWKDVENVEFFVEESDGDMVKESIFNRNLKVEDRLGIAFEYVGIAGNYDNRSAYLASAQNAQVGGDDYDMYAAYSMTTAMCAYAGLCQNLREYPVIDFEKPWWPDLLVSEGTVNNKLYFCAGDLSTNMLYMMYTWYFNKDILDNYKLTLPYDLVANNEWTYAKMFEMAAAVGGETLGTEKLYGFATSSNVHLDPFFYGAGLRTLDKLEDGTPVISESFGSERAATVAEQTQAFLHQPYSTYQDGNAFTNGQAMFRLDRARYASKSLGDATFEYGVVPMPKFDTEQENYTTILGFPYTLYAISVSSKAPEAAAAALEVMGSEGYRTITPALFEITMKVRYTTDGQASQMFDIIRETVSFDIGRIFTSNLDNIPYSLFRNGVSAATYVSYSIQFKAQKKVIEKDLQALIDTFAALAN